MAIDEKPNLSTWNEPIARLRSLCIARPEVTERLSHGEPAWFYKDKRLFVMFANHHHDDRVTFWCAAPEGAQAALVASDPTHYFHPPYIGWRGWLGAYLDVPVDEREITEIVRDAYETVAVKRVTKSKVSKL